MLVTSDGKRLVTGSGLTIASSPASFVDSFARPDGELGNDWIDGHDWDNTAYEPLGIHEGSVVVRDPTARVGADYAEDQAAAHPPADGKQNVGIGCAWRDLDTTKVRVKIRWNGLNDISAGLNVEATPLLHVTPGTDEHGFGVWLSELFGTPTMIAGCISNPPEQFPSFVVDLAPFEHTLGQDRDFELRSDGTGVTAWMDGEQVSFSDAGTDPIPLPANLVGSTLHGFAVDAHYVLPWEDIPTLPAIHRVEMRPA